MSRIFLLCACLLLAACHSPPPPAATAATVATPSAPASPQGQSNQLRLTLDGKTWQADRDYFGAFHPPGMDKAVLMAGSFGPKDKHEQAFNLNLFGVDAPGHFFASGNTMSLKGLSSSAIQLANLSDQRYLIGGPLGYEVEVDLLQAGAGVIEATFSGRMTANDGSTVTVTDGYFFYRE